MIRQHLILAVTALTTHGAAAQAPMPIQGPAPTIVRGLCQKDGCMEFSVFEKTPVAKGPDGELFRTRIETFHASSQGRTSQGGQDGFIYCSAVRPAVISAPPGKPATAVLLAPDDPSPDWVLRRTANFAAIYFGVCHGAEAGRRAALDRQGVARGLGYHVALTQPKTVQLSRPEDILRSVP